MLSLVGGLSNELAAQQKRAQYNVLLIISDDLTATSLGCYGNKVCRTPNIDKLAGEGTVFTRAYCQATYCAPSRASMLFGYYPYASKATGRTSGRKEVGPDRDSWPQYFRKNGYHSARVSKVFHMGVPTDIAPGRDGEDDAASWDEKYNSPGPESKAPGFGETLQNNPGGLKKGAAGGNRFVVVEADGDDMVHSDGKTAARAVELIKKYKNSSKPFFLAVGFVRPHVPFVAPKKYFASYDYDEMVLPPKIPGDREDIPDNPGNRRTSANLQMDITQQKKLIPGYYASFSYMDALMGRVIKALEETGQRNNTIVIFTSDHGYHLGEHDMWSKVSIHEESARVPLIDLKTSKSRWPEHRAKQDADQLMLYAEAAKQLSDDQPISLAYAIITKAKSPAVQFLPVECDRERMTKTVDLMVPVWRAMKAGVDFASPSPMNCSTCPFQSRCPAYKG